MTTPAASCAVPSDRTTLWAVPRDRVWVRCPRCDGAALVVTGRVRCIHCAFASGGAARVVWCRCCRRWEGDGPAPLGDYVQHACLRCPACGRRRSVTHHVRRGRRPARVRCECGAAMTVVEDWVWPDTGRADGIEPYLGLPYYLATPCAGHVLWAANGEHLDYLERFVAAGIRPGPQNELGNKLPRWMLTAKHRQAVLAGLAHLCGRLEAIR